MKPNFLIAVSFLLLLFSSSCSKETIDSPPSKIEVDQKSAQIIEADNQFGLELFNLIIDEETKKSNLMVSPLSVSLALAMAYNGAEGETKSQMEAMLHKQGLTPVEINQAYKSLVAALDNHDPKVELSIANSIFYHEDYTIKSDFLQTNQNYFDAEVEDLDFSDASATLETINGWVKTQTHDKIDKIVNEISPYDVLYLINAIYFNGEWTYQFDKKDTEDRSFFTELNTELQVPTMVVEENFNYTSESEFELLELPYGSDKFSMLIFLPQEGHSANEVAHMLSPEELNSWLNNLVSVKKKVYLPKFEFGYDNDLVDNLETLGMLDAFSSTDANFTGISDDADLFISKVKHKSYIKVDEKGTEAAAVTSIGFETTSVGPEEPVFVVDHPFVFAIYEKDTKAILFIGKVTNPLDNNE